MPRTPYDDRLHVMGVEKASDEEDFHAELAAPIDADVIERRRKDAERKAALTERNIYSNILRHDTPASYRVIPNERLSQSTKLARAASLQAAAERRTRKRKEGGIAIHYDYRAWKKLKQAERDAFDLVKRDLAAITGRRWDAERDFYWSLTDGGADISIACFAQGPLDRTRSRPLSSTVMKAVIDRRAGTSNELLHARLPQPGHRPRHHRGHEEPAVPRLGRHSGHDRVTYG